MSWSPDFYIGELRPWPDEVLMRRGRTEETRRYVPERTCRNSAPTYLDFLCSECGFVHYHSDENDDGGGNEWHFCPNCGARRVDE